MSCFDVQQYFQNFRNTILVNKLSASFWLVDKLENVMNNATFWCVHIDPHIQPIDQQRKKLLAIQTDGDVERTLARAVDQISGRVGLAMMRDKILKQCCFDGILIMLRKQLL